MAPKEIDEDLFVKYFISALSNIEVVGKLKEANTDFLNEIKNLKDSATELGQVVTQVKQDLLSSQEEIKRLKTKVSTLQYQADSLEQYTRRNSLRIDGIPESGGENVYDVVLELFNEQLKTERKITRDDIDRAHRLSGKPSDGSCRTILVKFVSYQTRQLIFKAKKKLRVIQDHRVYINEDLTQIRQELLYNARKLKRMNKISDCWTYDGRVLVRTKDGRVVSIRDEHSFDRFQEPIASPSAADPRSQLSYPSPQSSQDSTHEQSQAISFAEPDHPTSVEANSGTKLLADGKLVCFLSEEAPLSNWYNSPMKIDGITYSCVEQYFMSEKAKAGHRDEISDQIMEASSPSKMCHLGKKIKGNLEFDEIAVMKKAINTKFDNPNLKQYLLSTGDAKLCEATGNSYWGIGVYLNTRDIYNITKWENNKLGQNKLGQLLMEKRADLKQKLNKS